MNPALLLMAKAAAAGGAFDPTDIASLYAGYEAGSFVGSDGDLVATWPELLGAHNATAAGGARPTYKTNIFGSEPAMRFGGSQQIDAGSWSSQAQPNTIIYCGKSTTGGRIADYVASGDRHLLQATSGGNIELFAGSVLGGGTFNNSTVEILVAIYNGGSSKVYQAGGSAAASGAGGSQAAASFRIGGGDGSSYFNGDIAAIYLFHAALSLTDINSMGDYLESKYGPTWTTAT